MAIFNSTKPYKLLHKQLLSDGFNMAARGNSVIKSHSSQRLKHCHARYKTLRQ